MTRPTRILCVLAAVWLPLVLGVLLVLSDDLYMRALGAFSMAYALYAAVLLERSKVK